MSRTLRALTALAIVSLIVAGCSNALAGTGSSSGGNNTPATAPPDAGSNGGSEITAATVTTNTASSSGTAATHEQAVKFAECMRANGVAEFPDPDASGQFVYGIKGGSSLDPSTAVWKKAISACKDREPPGALGEGKRNAQQMQAALKFAQCMRDNGVKDFPDPSDTGPLINVNGAHSIPGFQAAMDKCRDLLAVAAGGQ